MSAGYEIVRYQTVHKPLVAQLQTQLWSSDPDLNTRFLEWKYERNPGPGEPAIYLAFHGDKPVGIRGFHAASLEAGSPSRAFPVLIAGDAFISPAHRNRGLVTRMMKMVHADVAGTNYRYLVSLGGANPINALGLLTLGWKSAGPLRPVGRITARARRSHQISRVMTRLPLLWRFSESRFLSSAAQRNPFRHLDAVKPGPGDGCPISLERKPRLDAMVELVERCGHDGRVRYVRDREFLAWRFQSPLSEYRFLYWEDARLQGYLVLSRRASDIGRWDRVYIADLEASDMRVRSELLSAAIRWGQFPELVTWTASLSEEELQLLKTRGFTPVDPRDTARGCPCVLLRPVGDHVGGTEWMLGSRRMLDTRNWDIRVLYSMRG